MELNKVNTKDIIAFCDKYRDWKNKQKDSIVNKPVYDNQKNLIGHINKDGTFLYYLGPLNQISRMDTINGLKSINQKQNRSVNISKKICPKCKKSWIHENKECAYCNYKG